MASETNATVEPSAESSGAKLSALPWVPSVATESSAVTAALGDGADDVGGGGAALTADVPRNVMTSIPSVSPRFDQRPIGSAPSSAARRHGRTLSTR